MRSSFKLGLTAGLTALLLPALCATALATGGQSRVTAKESRSGRPRTRDRARTPHAEVPGIPWGGKSNALAAGSGEEGRTAARVRALERALESQNEKLEQMRRLIEQQQRLLQALVGPRSSEAGTERAVENAAHSQADPGSTRLGSVSGDEETPANAPYQSTRAPEPVEERLKKVEERVARIGPLRLSGDFRLRLDAILREATRPPDPPLARTQNVRMRYRLRLNMDAELDRALSFHGQVSTGPINNALTADQDFTSTVARHPLFISEAWVDYHPKKSIQLQGGRVQEVFADNSRFLFDDDIRFNGFNEKFALGLSSEKDRAISLELRAGQYWFSNPSVAVVAPGSPLARAGAAVGSIGRSAMLFHQGALLSQQFTNEWSHQFGADVQLFREPNQIQLASTPDGAVLLVQPGLGIALSGPMTGTGNATTTPGGAIYSARSFQVGRLTYRLDHTGVERGAHRYPFSLSLQLARNFGTGRHERDALLAAVQLGKPGARGDMAFLYVFSIKGANSIISQLTDDDLGTGTGVNIRTHSVRWELGLARNVTLQSLLFVQRQLRNSGQFDGFFVPLGSFAPRQYRFQEQVVFSF